MSVSSSGLVGVRFDAEASPHFFFAHREKQYRVSIDELTPPPPAVDDEEHDWWYEPFALSE